MTFFQKIDQKEWRHFMKWNCYNYFGCSDLQTIIENAFLSQYSRRLLPVIWNLWSLFSLLSQRPQRVQLDFKELSSSQDTWYPVNVSNEGAYTSCVACRLYIFMFRIIAVFCSTIFGIQFAVHYVQVLIKKHKVCCLMRFLFCFQFYTAFTSGCILFRRERKLGSVG